MLSILVGGRLQIFEVICFCYNKIGKIIKKCIYGINYNLMIGYKQGVASYTSQMYNICDTNY